MKQHYIPRCYLKRFSNNERSIFTYDKCKSESYNASLMSVCCEDDLYSLSKEYVKSNNEKGHGVINELSIESDHFANTVEPYYAQFLKQLDEIMIEWKTGKEHYRLQYIEKRELALHIVTQYFRLPQIGNYIVDDSIRTERAYIDMMKEFMAKQAGDNEFRNLDIGISCEKAALHANHSFLDGELMMKFADAIAKNIFIFWTSEVPVFYTSDFPIVVSPYVQNVQSLYMGLAQYGGELTFPLSPNLVLSIFDREYFKNKEVLDGSFIQATNKEIRRQNFLRYMYATRHVFSYKNDFSLIKCIYTLEGKHPFLAPNHRTEIVSGLGKY